MSNYVKATNFTAKDALPSGNAGKIVKGTEIDVEFTAIASAISSKADTASPTFTGTPAAPTAAVGTNTTQVATTAFVNNERTSTATLTNKTLTAPKISTISNTGTLTLPTSTDTLVGRATTDTLTNKTINLASNTLTATSAQLAAAVTDETGTGSLVFATSPALAGTPTAPTAAAGTNTTQLATTAFVNAERSASITLTNKTLASPIVTGTLDVQGDGQVVKTSGSPSFNLISNQASGYSPARLGLTRYGASSGPTPDGSTLGEIRFDGLTPSSAYMNCAFIYAQNGTNASGGAPASLLFGTASSGSNATERMRIDSSGNVGIGTGSPSSYGKFAVVGSGDIGVFSNATNSDLRINIGTSVSSITNTQNAPLTFGTNNTERMRIDSSGNVGIGNSSPTEKLDVTGNIKASGSLTLGTDLAVSEGGTGASSITANSVILGNGTGALSGNLVAPGTSGNILTSNGTTWASSAPAVPSALSTASGSAPSYSARAWVNFNGTGTVAVRSSGNVSSITDLGVGSYEVNFTTSMSDANYCVVGSSTSVVGTSTSDVKTTFRVDTDTRVANTTAKATISTVSKTDTALDTEDVNIVVFR